MKKISILFLTLLAAACVSQTTIESKVPDANTRTDNAFRAQVHTERAAEYYRLGNMAIALEAVQQALSAMPDYNPGLNVQGLIYMELHEDSKAALSFERALKAAPNDSDTLNNYGWFVCQRQDTARSIALFQEALKNPLYVSPQRAYLNAGLCARKLKDLTAAEQYLQTALRIQPNLSSAIYELADMRMIAGRNKEAETFLAQYMGLVQAPSMEALLLGVRIARASANKSAEASYIQQLRRRFADAPETRAVIDVR